MRTIIDISSDQKKALDAVCTQRGVSRAQAVRDAVGLYLRQFNLSHQEDEAFGAWRERGVDGADYQQRVRAQEWV
jgi:metal-responsive CopG/Arc/MetJ family transcriptional regulator